MTGTLPATEVDAYLARIGHTGSLRPDATTLAELQAAHLVSVPFENLHVVAGLPVRTTVDWSYPKIVERGHGGWCFELNGAFGALLESLGFAVTRLSAQVWDAGTRQLGPPLDHLCLLVESDGERWLVDVGFGDSSIGPVRIDTTDEQPRRPRPVRIERAGGERDGVLHLFELGTEWVLQYAIDLTPRALPEFQPRSDALAAGDGGGFFSSKPFATRALDPDGGRVWLLRDRLKLRSGDAEPVEQPVDDWDAALTAWFGITRPS